MELASCSELGCEQLHELRREPSLRLGHGGRSRNRGYSFWHSLLSLMHHWLWMVTIGKHSRLSVLLHNWCRIGRVDLNECHVTVESLDLDLLELRNWDCNLGRLQV